MISGGKIKVYLVFRSLNRTFDMLSKVGCILEMKIKWLLFCISLDLHYL